MMPRLKLIWADGAYGGEKLRGWCEEHAGCRLEIVPRDLGKSTFEVLPKRWVHASHRVPYQYVGSRDAGVVKEGAQVGNHIGVRARSSSRCRVALSPSGTIEPADPGEPGYLLLNRCPVLARGTQPRLQDHRRAAFTNAVDSQPVSAHVHQSVLAITRGGAIHALSPPCLQLLPTLQAVAASVPTVSVVLTQKRIIS